LALSIELRRPPDMIEVQMGEDQVGHPLRIDTDTANRPSKWRFPGSFGQLDGEPIAKCRILLVSDPRIDEHHSI
jgi:hypothetical protein